MKAMILAAGRGERMRPLTDATPKPLLPVGGKPLIVWHIERLAAAGVHDIVINHAWLGAQIEAALGDGSQWGVRIAYSAEAVALETAGGIAQALPLLGSAPFLLISADIYTDYPLAQLVAVAQTMVQDQARLAHVVMVDNPPYHPIGDWALSDGRIDPAGADKLCYANLAVLKPAVVDGVAPGSIARLGPILAQAAANRQVSGEHYGGDWYNVGTPDELAAADHAARR
ncbi:MAG: nucleotidyltransferase family protein [Burkholderiales bacterium]|nr:nucleotidyltransferase family protein [Burkholderiales bacterium]